MSLPTITSPTCLFATILPFQGELITTKKEIDKLRLAARNGAGGKNEEGAWDESQKLIANLQTQNRSAASGATAERASARLAPIFPCCAVACYAYPPRLACSRHLQNEIARYKSEASEAAEALKKAKEGAAGAAGESEQVAKLTKVRPAERDEGAAAPFPRSARVGTYTLMRALLLPFPFPPGAYTGASGQENGRGGSLGRDGGHRPGL